MHTLSPLLARVSARQQRGVTTLAITLLLLVILTVIVLFSTNVAFFEQRTSNNENRARLAEQASEYAVNLAGEYLKANRTRIISNKPGSSTTGGWLATTASTGKKWLKCADVTGFPNIADLGGTPHPCMNERDATRRGELWFYTTDAVGATKASTQIPYGSVTGDVGNVGGTAAFPTNVTVQALLCRIDSTLATPACADEPSAGNRIAVTLVAEGQLTGESATATVKETWASFTDFSPSSAVPLVGSGFVKGLGNAQIVVSPNAGGYGVPASVWSPNDVGMGDGKDVNGVDLVVTCPQAGGIGSVSTCHIGEFLKNTPEAELKTTCPSVNNACACPTVADGGSDFLSGHSGSTKEEDIDILDIDSGDGSLPDIAFFPGADCTGTQYDDPTDSTDDSLFEWIFNSPDVVSEGGTTTNVNCGSAGDQNCATYVLLEELSAESVTCAALNALGPNASGLYYINDYGTNGECSMTGGIGAYSDHQFGTPDSPVIIVADERIDINQSLIYGMLFVRSDNPFDPNDACNTTTAACLKATGQAKVYGSVVVEGHIDIAGSIDIVYDDTSVSGGPNDFPKAAKFGRVPGSWLDAGQGF